MLTAFPIAEVERVVKRTAYTAIGVGVVLSGIAILLGQPWFVPGIAVGIGLAIANHRVFQSSAMRFTTPDGVVRRKPFAGSVALRLGVCTAIAILGLIWNQPFGWGVIAGLALYQATMLFNALLSLMRFQRKQAAGGGADD